MDDPQQQQQLPPPSEARLHPKKKLISAASAREQRRKAVLQRQREARRELTDHLRDLVLHALDGGDGKPDATEEALPTDEAGTMAMAVTAEDTTTPAHRGSPRRSPGRHRKKRGRQEDARFYASQFCVPEWLVEMPGDLCATGDDAEGGHGWFVMARPEGRRCLMVASGGATVTRLATGDILHRFPSALPNGSARSKGPKDGWTLLDCVYHEANQTYFVLDLLCWRNMELYDCTCEFRLFFLRSKFAEDLHPLPADEAARSFRLVPLLYSNSDPAGIRKAYADAVPFVRDGLLFFERQGYYVFGLSPLALVWKDQQSSRYFLSQPLSCVLRVQPPAGAGAYALCTLDGLVVGRATADEVAMWGLEGGEGGGEGALVRFLYTAATEDEATDQHQLHGLRFDKKCSASRATADPWSKLLFHSRATEGGGGITIDHLLQAYH